MPGAFVFWVHAGIFLLYIGLIAVEGVSGKMIRSKPLAVTFVETPPPNLAYFLLSLLGYYLLANSLWLSGRQLDAWYFVVSTIPVLVLWTIHRIARARLSIEG